MNTLANEFTTGPGEYQLNESLIRNTISYPWAPTTTIQRGGGSVLDKNFTDVESEIKNITRPLTNNPQKKYVPGAEGEEQKMIHFQDGFFHQPLDPTLPTQLICIKVPLRINVYPIMSVSKFHMTVRFWQTQDKESQALQYLHNFKFCDTYKTN